MNNTVLPSPDDIRAARAFLNWKQLNLAHKCDVSVKTIISIENNQSKPTKELLETIARVFMGEGIMFHPTRGFMVDKSIVTIYEGENCFLDLVDNILNTYNSKDGDVLFLGNDDRKSVDKVIKKDAELYKNKIYPKYLVARGNNYLLGPVEDYRAIEPMFFTPIDLTIIYSGKVAFDLWDFKSDDIKTHKIIVINESNIYNRMKNYFYNLWEKAEIIPHSSTKQIFFKKK